MRLPRHLKSKGPLTSYVERQHSNDARARTHVAREIVLAVREIAGTPAGRMLFALLDEATAVPPEPGADERALREWGAQRLMALDLQRLASDESDPLLRETDPRGA